jgi:ubiquinone biosynthesis protein
LDPGLVYGPRVPAKLPATSTRPESVLGVAIRDIGRLRHLVAIMSRHGFGEVVARSPLGKRYGEGASEDGEARPAPVRFRELLEELGPTWIKLGQILSTRHDLLPPEWIEALAELQDNTGVVEYEAIKQVVEDALGRSLEEAFAEFDVEPLATASIAQTHLATTHAGERVVVKVQRPNIEASMRGDLDLLYIGARMLESTIEELQLYSPSEIVAEFERGLLRELNFGTELSNLETARALLEPDRPVVVPRPYPELSGKTVLTMEYFPGRPIRALVRASPEAKRAAAEIVRSAARQVFVDGFFHGDPHAGNILVNDQNTLCMIDLGLVGRLNAEQRAQIVTLVVAALTNDTSTMASVLLAMGTPTQRVNLAELKAEISRIRREQLDVGSLGKMDSGKFVQEFAAAAAHFRIKLAPEYSIMIKAAGTLEGVVRALDPEVDIAGIARPWAERIVAERFAPEHMLEAALSRATGVGGLVSRMPDQLEQLMHDVETGNLQLRALTPELDQLPKLVRWASGRLSWGLFSSAMSLCAAVLIASEPLWFVAQGLGIFCVLAAVLGWTATFLSYFVGSGHTVRLGPIIRLFRRE